MVSASDFLGGDGVSIQWRQLAVTLFGAGLLAYFEGAIRTFLSLADIPIGLLAGTLDFLGAYVSLSLGFPAVLINAGWAGAIPYVLEAGIAGYLVAITIVLLTMYVVAQVVDRV